MITDNDVKKFIYEWFAGFDHMEDPSKFIKYLPEQNINLNYLGEIIKSRDNFIDWLKTAQEAITTNSHQIEKLYVATDENKSWTAEIDLIWIADKKDGKHEELHINQIWEIIVLEQDKLIINTLKAILRKDHLTESNDNLKEVYNQLCSGYHGVDKFRSTLLGFLPFASGAAIYGVLISSDDYRTPSYLLKIGIFGALFTLGLLIYELKGIQKCTAYIRNGAAIENKLLNSYSGLNGMFSELNSKRKSNWIASEPIASAIIYATIIGSWLYLASLFYLAAIVSVIAFIGSIIFWRMNIRTPHKSVDNNFNQISI